MAGLITEKIVSSQPLFDGGFLHVQKLTVQLPDGRMAFREVTRHRGAVVIVPVWPDKTVTVVKQYRPAIDAQSIEAPAGLLDPNEDTLTAAKRELEEETGLRAERWYYLATVASSPGFCDEKVALYAAAGLSEGNTHFDEDEFLVSERVPMDRLYEMILSGEVVNSSTVSAFLLACDKMRKGEIEL